MSTPPRLAYLLKKFPRLSETFILNELLAQERLGQSLRVFSRRPPDDEPRHPQLEQLRAPVELLPHSREVDPWTELFVHDEGDLVVQVSALTRRGVLKDHPRFPSLLAEAVFLRRRCRELGVEHLHVHFATDGALLAWLLRQLGGPSYSITMHAKDIYRSTVDAQVLERLVAGSSFVVTVCDANVDWLGCKIGARAMPRVRRLYNGIDLQLFSPGDTPREADHVLAVGRLVEKKGFDVLIDAAARLAGEGRRPRFTIVGDGDQRDALAARIAAHGLHDTVHLAGPLDQHAVLALMRSATLFCLPCRVGEDGNRDALPTVLLEALACGLPVVSTPVTGIPEIVDHGQAGRLVPEDDVEATARALSELLGDEALRGRLSTSGREHAGLHFDLQRNSRTLKSWFDEALAGSAERCSSPV
jgi:glycosyltransferase involved in cell wall biosynthesis